MDIILDHHLKAEAEMPEDADDEQDQRERNGGIRRPAIDRAMIAEHKHLAEQGAQIVELRLDFILTPINLKRILAERPCPVVITIRRQRDGVLEASSRPGIPDQDSIASK